jgi:hypothetical protein
VGEVLPRDEFDAQLQKLNELVRSQEAPQERAPSVVLEAQPAPASTAELFKRKARMARTDH